MSRYFEDFRIGETHEYGSYTLSEKEIIDFAEKYDPQPFHTDPKAAKEMFTDGLIASGWQTACVAMRLAVEEGYLQNIATVVGVGVDNLTWSEPVRPGDSLWVREEIVEKRESESSPDQGVLRIEITVFNQQDTEVLSMDWIDLVERRASQ